MTSRVVFQVAYDGEALRDHYMDVHQLAPALLAFGDLVKAANRELNGDKVKVNLLVSSDFEHRCFNIDFEIVQTMYDTVKSFLKDDSVQTAKDIAEWLGILGGAPAVALIGYLRYRRGRQIESATTIEQGDDTGKVAIRFQGDGNTINVHQHVYRLGESSPVRQAMVKVLAPLDDPGIDSVEFRENDMPVVRVADEDADAIRQSCEVGGDDAIDPQVVQARLTLYAAVFDPAAKKWKFRYAGNVIDVDISETSIATDAIKRGGVYLSDVYRVDLEITEEKTRSGAFTNRYKIKRVHSFNPGPRQTSLPFDEPDVEVDDEAGEEGGTDQV